jgi:hypothetical protein
MDGVDQKPALPPHITVVSLIAGYDVTAVLCNAWRCRCGALFRERTKHDPKTQAVISVPELMQPDNLCRKPLTLELAPATLTLMRRRLGPSTKATLLPGSWLNNHAASAGSEYDPTQPGA